MMQKHSSPAMIFYFLCCCFSVRHLLCLVIIGLCLVTAEDAAAEEARPLAATVSAQEEGVDLDGPGRVPEGMPPSETEIEMPTITPGPTLSLAEALRTVQQRNVTLTVARYEIDKANSQLSSTWAVLAPVLGAQASYLHNDHADTFNPMVTLEPVLANIGMPIPSNGELIVRQQEILRGGVMINLPLVVPQAWAGIRGAQLGVEVSKLTFENSRDRLLLATAQAYWVTVVNRELVDVHQNQVRAAAEHLDLAKVRFNAGDGLRIDVVRAETELEAARQELLTAHLTLDNARDSLGTLTGMDGLPMPSEPPTLHPIDDSDTQRIDETSEKRSDIRAAQAAVTYAEQLVDVAWMKFLPTLGIGAQYDYLFSDPPDLGSDDRSRWAVLITLTVPLYDQSRYADLDARRVALRQALARSEEVIRNAKLEARRARRDYLSSVASIQIATHQVALAREGLALAESAYKNGANTSLDVSDAQRALRNAELGLVAQRLRGQIALLNLLYSVGEDLRTVAQKNQR